MIKHLRLPLRFDAPRMLAETEALAEGLWKDHYQERHYEGGWRALPLRSLGGRADDILISPVEGAVYEDTPLLTACPYLREVLSAFRCPLQAVRLMKLDAGALIKPHRDNGLCVEQGQARFHIPVLTHPEVEFILDGERVDMAEGECWYLNFDLPHSVRNGSPVDRIHLVLDAEADPWLDSLFAGPGVDRRRDMDEMERYSRGERLAMIQALRGMGTPASARIADDLEAKLPPAP